jgi:two-component SAPR family response regulator
MMLCLSAVECDALRESANLLLVSTCRASGDWIRAIRHAQRYAKRLKDELGLPPPPTLAELLTQA